MNWYNKCVLFKSFDRDQFEEQIGSKYLRIKHYQRAETIANQGDDCHAIGIVQDGHIELVTLYSSGKVLSHVQLGNGDVFGEAIVFNPTFHSYPVDIRAIRPSKIAFIEREQLLQLFQKYPVVLHNYLTLMSQRLLLLNQKIRSLSLDTLDKRIAHYLLQLYRQKQSVMFQTGLTRKSMAEMMGVQRPSLSRTLAVMRDNGLIDYDGDAFKLLDIEKLEQLLVSATK